MNSESPQKPLLTGVIGYPIAHSRSPAVHGYWIRRLGLRAFYVPMEVTRVDFPDVLRSLAKMGFRGVNITVPHKETALQRSDSLSDEAALIGAVNTLTISSRGKIHGDNTDVYGFLQNLRSANSGWSAKDAPTLVLGAGGAARGVIFALISDGAEEIHVVNRTRERAERLKNDFGYRVTTHDFSSVPSLVPKMGTVINTTSLGMENKPSLTFPYEKLTAGTVVTDLVYTPLNTMFLQQAEAQGCVTVDGLGMLLHQAAASFYHWFGTQPAVDANVRRAALGA